MADKKKKINISEKELERDIANLFLPEINLMEDIDKPRKDNPAYDDQLNKWLRNGRKDEDKPDYL
ncbi:hypothetical protein [Lutibacter sp.]|uniref:hypothetical protein n=1 Tax=Lutibacter sp. TaxID=1925666 RepID=UPI0034A02A95